MEVQFSAKNTDSLTSPISQIFEIVDSVCVLKHCLVESTYFKFEEDKYAQPALFEVDTFDSLNLSTSLFIRKLLSYLDLEPKVKTHLYEFVEGADRHTSVKKLLCVHDYNWIPPMGSYIYTEESHPKDYNDAIQKVKEWLSGRSSKSQLLRTIDTIK